MDTTGLRSPSSNGRLAMIGDSRLKDVILMIGTQVEQIKVANAVRSITKLVL